MQKIKTIKGFCLNSFAANFVHFIVIVTVEGEGCDVEGEG